MIVVEGPDGAGKTTLIERLQALTGLEVAPRVVSKKTEAMVDLKRWTEDNVAKGFQHLIFDRHRLISEPIYGPALREKPEPGFDDPVWFIDQLQRFYGCDPILIYCLPPFEWVWRNILEDEANDNSFFKGSPQKVRQIYGAYFNKAVTDRVLRGDTWLYDYTDDMIGPMFPGMIANYINRRINNV